ncbi:MAG: hypothetical protein ACYDBH_01245 [Acidobacteriaceae bacterium]
MRPFISILTTLMLALTFVQAPFQHFHEHEENNRHPHSGFFHVHFHHYDSAGSKTEISAVSPDDDAVFQSWYANVSRDLIVPVFLLASVCDFTVEEHAEPFVDRAISRGHDPPPRSCTAPRAPPV